MTDKSVAVLLTLWALEIGMTSQKYTASNHIHNHKLFKDPTSRKNIIMSCRQDGSYIHLSSVGGRQLVVSQSQAVVSSDASYSVTRYSNLTTFSVLSNLACYYF